MTSEVVMYTILDVERLIMTTQRCKTKIDKNKSVGTEKFQKDRSQKVNNFTSILKDKENKLHIRGYLVRWQRNGYLKRGFEYVPS